MKDLFAQLAGHKLGFWDMIPVLSYLFAKGKCRYCGEKIRIRYLILEVLSGLVFLLEYIALNMKFPEFDLGKIIFFISFVFMYITIAIIAGIDKEYRKIHLGVVLFGVIMQGAYILYLYIALGKSIYRYSIYLIVIMLLCLLDTVIVKKTGESKYILEVLIFLSYLISVVGPELMIISVIVAIIFMIIYNLYRKIKQNFYDEPDILKENEIPKTRIGFFLGISTVLVTIIETFITYYII